MQSYHLRLNKLWQARLESWYLVLCFENDFFSAPGELQDTADLLRVWAAMQTYIAITRAI